MADGEAAAEPPPDEDVDLLVEKDLYKILGVRRGANAEEIKKAYRKRSLKYHPDKNLNDPDAKEKFQKIAEAFSILSDDKKRLKYDKSGDMDLEDFDMDQFMNMWVGEMMEEGGMVDDMMREVMPWTDDEDKMKQFMEEKTKTLGKKVLCTICQTSVSNKRLMLAHFEQKHQLDCEDWANETLKSMKASFESFMKQITGIGDGSNEFILPDGTKADMSKVKGVPDIRGHMQKRVDKAKDAEAVMDMYRKVDADGSTYTPPQKEVERLLGLSAEEARTVLQDKAALLAALKEKIDKINNEEEEEDILETLGEGLEGLEGIAGLGGLGGLGGIGGSGGKGFGKGFGGKGGMFPGMAGMDMEALLGGMDPDSLEGLQAMMGGLGGLDGLEGLLGGMPPGAGRFGCPPCGPGFGGSRGSREKPADAGPQRDISCKCGYSCGTMKALEKHLDKFKGDPGHEAQVTERPPSPARPVSRSESDGANVGRKKANLPEDDLGFDFRDCLGELPPGLPPGFYERLGIAPPSFAERLGMAPPGGGGQRRTAGLGGAASGPYPPRPSGGDSDSELGCICGYTCGTVKALQRHLDRFAGDPAHVRK